MYAFQEGSVVRIIAREVQLSDRNAMSRSTVAEEPITSLVLQLLSHRRHFSAVYI